MRRAAVLGLVLFGLAAGNAEGQMVHLHANHHVRTWRSPATFSPRAVLTDEVMIEGHSLPTTTVEGCLVTWAGRGIAVTANTCGNRSLPIRLRYVALGKPKSFRFSYHRLRRVGQP